MVEPEKIASECVHQKFIITEMHDRPQESHEFFHIFILEYVLLGKHVIRYPRFCKDETEFTNVGILARKHGNLLEYSTFLLMLSDRLDDVLELRARRGQVDNSDERFTLFIFYPLCDERNA